MKVKLTGINPQIYNDPRNDFYTNQLLEYTYPIEVVRYKGSMFFDDKQEVEIVIFNNEEWSLQWFTYEELEEIQD